MIKDITSVPAQAGESLTMARELLKIDPSCCVARHFLPVLEGIERDGSATEVQDVISQLTEMNL